MRKKHTTENAGGASAAEKIALIFSKVDDLQYDLYRLNCFANIAESSTADIFTPRPELSGSTGVYYAGDAEKKILGFATSETVALSNAVDGIVGGLLADLKDIRDVLERYRPVREPQPVRGEALHNLFRAWEQAYASWVATKRDGNIPDGTPEFEAERRAALALAAHPCTTPDDVGRKSRLFLENSYLRDSAPEFAIELLTSFNAVKNI
ncbi:hypothetical protein EYC79_03795 [Agrobacterium cavarae]|uniref:Uncharacterized protein n=1 Tax=Agrobacterium cavarae TaxID=2528239 RepID=A0ABY1YBP1_9HYPH|nr:hypothetical protein [Agrobacterium cavarae]TBN16944.1 hypothetical protein EYC79_03795 [Agrobacterium cavarae]